MAASNAAEFAALVNDVRSRAVRFGNVGNLELLRWDDPSGARFVFGIEGGKVVDFLPSFSVEPATSLARVRMVNDDIATAAVVDDDGDQLTGFTFELEQFRLLAERTVESALAAVVFLGRSISVHTDSEAFSNSVASLLDANADTASPAPSHYVDRGWKWPPRVAEESFFSYGVFGEPSKSNANARFAGTVISAERRTNEETKQTFIVVKVCTTGIDATVCVSGDELDSVPLPGQVIAGDVFIVGSIPILEPAQASRRRWRDAAKPARKT